MSLLFAQQLPQSVLQIFDLLSHHRHCVQIGRVNALVVLCALEKYIIRQAFFAVKVDAIGGILHVLLQDLFEVEHEILQVSAVQQE